MVIKKVKVTNEIGLHQKTAVSFLKKAHEFKSDIRLRKKDDKKRANAKMFMDIISLGICKGNEVELIADGPDEELAITALIELLK